MTKSKKSTTTDSKRFEQMMYLIEQAGARGDRDLVDALAGLESAAAYGDTAPLTLFFKSLAELHSKGTKSQVERGTRGLALAAAKTIARITTKTPKAAKPAREVERAAAKAVLKAQDEIARGGLLAITTTKAPKVSLRGTKPVSAAGKAVLKQLAAKEAKQAKHEAAKAPKAPKAKKSDTMESLIAEHEAKLAKAPKAKKETRPGLAARLAVAAEAKAAKAPVSLGVLDQIAPKAAKAAKAPKPAKAPKAASSRLAPEVAAALQGKAPAGTGLQARYLRHLATGAAQFSAAYVNSLRAPVGHFVEWCLASKLTTLDKLTDKNLEAYVKAARTGRKGKHVALSTLRMSLARVQTFLRAQGTEVPGDLSILRIPHTEAEKAAKAEGKAA